MNGGENIYSVIRTLGGESLLMLLLAAGHPNRNKVVAWKTTIVKKVFKDHSLNCRIYGAVSGRQ